MTDAIIVGVDGSTASTSAIKWAAERARDRGLPLEVVYIVDDYWGSMGERELGELHPDIAGVVDDAAAVARTIAPDTLISARVHTGDPMVELAEASRTAAMIVVGTHKTGFFHGRAFGSRSLQLAAMAWCPVAVIPGFTSALRKSIVVGVDDSAASAAAIDFAAEESIATSEPLVFVHGTEEPARDPARRTTTLTQSLTRAAMVRAKAVGVTELVRAREIARPAAEALIDAALQANLLVIGTSRRRGIEQSALGPVAHDVLMNITGPTVVVHGDMNPSTTQPRSTL
ncbi:MAG: universal stress protein [Actinomycetota bacterium]